MRLAGAGLHHEFGNDLARAHRAASALAGGRVFAQRQPHQRHPVRRHALRDGTVHQFQLLLVQSQFDDRLGHEQFLRSGNRSGSNPVYRICRFDRDFYAVCPACNFRHRSGNECACRAHAGLFPVLPAIRSAKFGRCAAVYSSASTKIAASCVRNSELSYAKYPPILIGRVPQRDFRMSKKSTRVDFACKALRQAIIEQALPPGTKLPEDELGARFGMSRTLVRAALGSSAIRRPGRRAAAAHRDYGEADAGRSQGSVRGPPHAGARGGAAGDRALAAGIRRRTRGPCPRGRGRAQGRRGAGFDPARRRIPYPARRDGRQRPVAALSRRSGVALFADIGAIWPAAFRRLRRQRAPRDRRRLARPQCGRRHRGDGPSSRLGRAPRAAGPGPRCPVRSRRGAVALCRGRGCERPVKDRPAAQAQRRERQNEKLRSSQSRLHRSRRAQQASCHQGVCP